MVSSILFILFLTVENTGVTFGKCFSLSRRDNEFLPTGLTSYVRLFVLGETISGGCASIRVYEGSMDLNVRAFRVVQAAVSDTSPTVTAKKASSRKGGLIGGPSRASSISAERRHEIAQKASTARWSKQKSGR